MISEQSSTLSPQFELIVVFKYVIIFELAIWQTVKSDRAFEKY